MSTTLSSRYCWRGRQLRRLYSSSTTETSQTQPRHAPIAIDLGGVQIGSSNSRSSRQTRHADSLDLREFKKGSLSQRLAIREIAQRQRNTPQSRTATESQTGESTDPSRQPRNGLYARSRQLERRQESRQTEVHQNERRPARQRTRPQRRPRSVGHEHDAAQMMHMEEQEEWFEAIEDNTGTKETRLVLRRADPPLAPPKTRLPPSLTVLNHEIYIDAPTRKLQERIGGDYTRYFSSNEWRLAHAQASGPLGVADYARLMLRLNRTVPMRQKAEGIEIVRKHAERAKAVTTGS